MKNKRKLFAAVGLVLLLAVLVLLYRSCFGYKEKQIFAMDTYCTLEIAGSERTLEQMEQLILDYDAKYDAYDKNAAVYGMNQAGYTDDPETVALIRSLLDYTNKTGGAFDFTMKKVSDLWGFHTDAPKVPGNIDFSVFGSDKLTVDGSCVYFNGVEVDFGGVMKGYATDRLKDVIKQEGIKKAVLNLGGNVYAAGEARVGIQDPARGGALACSVAVCDKAVVTSGVYQRKFQDENGKLWHHILDPKTGYSADSGLLSVTVIGENATECDVLSTAFLVMGKEKAVECSKQFDVEVILVEEGILYCSSGISEDLKVEETYTKEVF